MDSMALRNTLTCEWQHLSNVRLTLVRPLRPQTNGQRGTVRDGQLLAIVSHVAGCRPAVSYSLSSGRSAAERPEPHDHYSLSLGAPRYLSTFNSSSIERSMTSSVSAAMKLRLANSLAAILAKYLRFLWLDRLLHSSM